MIYFLAGILLTQLLYTMGAFRQPRNVPVMIYSGYLVLQLLFFLVLFSAPFNEKLNWSALLFCFPFFAHQLFLQSFLVEKDLIRKDLAKRISKLLFVPVCLSLVLMVLNEKIGQAGLLIFIIGMIAFLAGWTYWLLRNVRKSDAISRPLLLGGMLLTVASFFMLIQETIPWIGKTSYVVLVLCELFLFHLFSAKNRVRDELELAATQQQLIEQLNKNEALEYSRFSIRNKIARDLHDELGATLSGVVLFSELSKRSIERNESHEVAPYLYRISDVCNTMSEKINDIVWTSHEGYDKLYKVMDRLQDYIKPICAGNNIVLDFHADGSLLELDMEVEKSNQVYMLSKEALNNAVKYAAPTNIRYQAVRTGSGCKITIEDNGRGFDLAAVKMGNGIRYMQQRCEELKAVFSLVSAPGKGTFIQLEF
jgi:signal transduction histidine kinase